MIKPFEINVDDALLEDLLERLEKTRWPDEVGTDWSYGTDLTYLKELCHYWQHDFDWRTQEADLNRFDHFTTEINEQNVHFIHQKSSREDALPLIITHGWPGSIAEFRKIIDPLTEPEKHGGDASDAFHVVCPSIPGYGFSDAPQEPGFDQKRAAEVNVQLMQQLGYDRYGAQGGDWGSAISSWMAVVAPEKVCGIHLNLIFAGYPSHKENPFEGVSEQEQAKLAERQEFMRQETGYQQIQGSKPQTLGYGLNDSPAGLAAWITEKFYTWTDCAGNIENSISKDDLLTNIMIYWITQSITSSTRLYYESGHVNNDLTKNGRIETPTGCAIFPGELYLPPRVWAEELYNVQHWSLMAEGGHFAAMEKPQMLVEDLQKFFRRFR